MNYYMFLLLQSPGRLSTIKQPSAQFAIGDTVSDSTGVFVSDRPAWFLTVHSADGYVLARVSILQTLATTCCAVLVSKFRVEEIVDDEERERVLTDWVLDASTGELSVFVKGNLVRREHQ